MSCFKNILPTIKYATKVIKSYKLLVFHKSTLSNLNNEKSFSYYKTLAKKLGIEQDEIVQTTAFAFARMDMEKEKELEKMQINMEKELEKKKYYLRGKASWTKSLLFKINQYADSKVYKSSTII